MAEELGGAEMELKFKKPESIFSKILRCACCACLPCCKPKPEVAPEPVEPPPEPVKPKKKKKKKAPVIRLKASLMRTNKDGAAEKIRAIVSPPHAAARNTCQKRWPPSAPRRN